MMHRTMTRPTWMRLLLLVVILCVQCSWSYVFAQTTTTTTSGITIGGNVYGGGNEGKVHGNTTVTVHAGDLNDVYGGARMADVGGRAFVNVDGENASDNIIITSVYGGNDIAGTVGSDPENTDPIPSELTEVLGDNETKADYPQKNAIDNTWNAYVRTSPTPETAQASDRKSVIIGTMFGGGNGDYYYWNEGDEHAIYMSKKDYEAGNDPIASNSTGFTVPDLGKTYLEILGGCIAHLYGGGNNATITKNTTISINNNSPVLTETCVWPANPASEDGQAQLAALVKRMKMSTFQSDMSSYDFNFARVFGGNNKATMAIRPVWNLSDGIIRDLYSGGNRGDMIYENGLFLEIPSYSEVVVNNVYGGCRMADVNPQKKNDASGEYEPVNNVSSEDIPVYKFPANLAARVMIAGGDINNVYGGNDIRGKVYFGNAIGILTSIRGNVYGGGNGAYAYTNNEDYENHELYGDFWYDLTKSDGSGNYANPLDALNALRPNAEQVSIFLEGKEKIVNGELEITPTIIKGSIFVGGNCASLITDSKHSQLAKYPLTELKMGSHVIAENVFLGNNGERMVADDILTLYNTASYSTLNLTDPTEFSHYMEGVALAQVPSLVVADEKLGDRVTYQPYTSYIGSLYYGGNRGSMTYSGANNITPSAPIYIYNKLVAGCNNANVAETPLNARYEGGLLGSASEGEVAANGEPTYTDEGDNIKDRVVMNLSKIRLTPKRLNSAGTGLEWNTVFRRDHYDEVASGTTLTKDNIYYTSENGDGEFIALGTETADADHKYYVKTNGYVETTTPTTTGPADDDDLARRLLGANIYGGCYESGHVNGNVQINLNGSLLDRSEIFDHIDRKEGDDDEILYDYEKSDYNITERKSGVILNEQGMDVLGEALTVFGGGKGPGTQIWGSATVNIGRGYTFQVFGGSEEGAIGKGTWNPTTNKYDYTTDVVEKYSTYVNLNGTLKGESRDDNSSEDIPDVEFIYGGGFSGPILGNTYVHLDNGRLFNLFAGSCNADINGHTETYVGLNGFPYLRDHIYGGNDLGGEIMGVKDFHESVRNYDQTKTMIHGYNASRPTVVPNVLKANTYIEYRNGSMKSIFGGCFGDYDYEKEFSGYSFPRLHNAFVNIRPDNSNETYVNHIDKVFGAGEGCPGIRQGDKMQDRSYVLVDIDNNYKGDYSKTEVFGGGSNNGLGMGYTAAETFDPGFNLDDASAIVDLVHGKIAAAYGGSYNEGVTRRTVVNVPDGSTINIGSIFGGAYGTQILPPCDVYESHVNYRNTSETALVTGALYGGNNNERRTLFANVNISSPVWQDKEKGYLATVYGAGKGIDTWSEHTEVNLENGAKVYEVYGGGEMGHVLNTESVQKYMTLYKDNPSPQIAHDDPTWGQRYTSWTAAWTDAWTMGDYFKVTNFTDAYLNNSNTNLSRISDRAELDANTASQLAGKKKFNTNVIINEGATVVNYAYGGGLGEIKDSRSGDIYGTTYIALLGGTVVKDIYAGGTAGGVYDLFGANNFTACANAYVQGGTVRNVYGAGWRGHVGYHEGAIHENVYSTEHPDIPGETRVVIGKIDGSSHVSGIPSVTRNIYGGGEGGSVYGTANVYMNNGYIGYRYNAALEDDLRTTYEDERYVPELDDADPGDNLLEKSGNVFGGGYIANSYVDNTNVEMYGGIVRGCLHGGGEIGPVGRGTMLSSAPDTGVNNHGAKIYKAGKARVQLFDGWVMRDVFGGGRGYDNWGGEGKLSDEEKETMDRSAKGYVFGQTEVDIYGGEVGTDNGVASGFGNVFGGGNIGFVYSAYEFEKEKTENDVTKKYTALGLGKKGSDGYYYESEGSKLTEDCKVLVEPWCKANKAISIHDEDFAAGNFVSTYYLNYLGNKQDPQWAKLSKEDVNKDGIIIHNAVFAGGNTSPGSSVVNANTTTVYGNATASIHDVFHRDLITIGTGHTGGLYGDGNLTLVDGYRELNITNYGTDYYNISSEISLEQYEALPDREGAYYELRYKCAQPCKDKNGKNYGRGSTITADELQTVFDGVTVDKRDVRMDDAGNVLYDSDGYPLSDLDSDSEQVPMLTVGGKPQLAYWIENGVCSRYAGRIMNTIQRADFCGVFGSRMVMQGAQDRVPETVDYTNYTINRVREVSLNKKESVRSEDASIAPSSSDYYRRRVHGNYFGIYNTVNFLGALTSDVDFYTAVRTTDNDDSETYKCPAGTDGPAYGTATFSEWKGAFHNDRKRNNGSSYNKVALASGVYLELTTEQGSGDGLYEKDWGYITGVVELDLINVQPGIGGGFVYAKNVHGVRSIVNNAQTTLTALNTGAVSRKKFTYATADADKKEWETSGNFVHSSQTIVDDCYNIGNRYKGSVNMDGTGAMPAHYWYIKGSVYVYDQYLSAYTGAPNAFSEIVNIPLTITSASHGRMTLMDVQPNYYAYKSSTTNQKLAEGEKLELRDITYHLNDPISYWDYSMLSAAEQALFVPMTYVTSDSCKIGSTVYPAGYVMLPSDYTDLMGAAEEQSVEGKNVKMVIMMTKDENGNVVEEKDRYGNVVYKPFTSVFHESNNLSHETGYILTYKVNNPGLWDTWYTPKSGSSMAEKKSTEQMKNLSADNYEKGPTYTPTTTGLYGQLDYKVGNIISNNIYTTFTTAYSQLTADEKAALGTPAEFKAAWIVTADVLETTNKADIDQRFYKGACLAKEDYTDAQWTAMSGSVAQAYVVTNTIPLSTTEYIYRDTRMTEAEKEQLLSKYASNAALVADITNNIVPAYYCTSEGKYGGDYFKQGNNYKAIDAFSSLSEGDRSNFAFNYDALDLLIDPTYRRAEAVKYQYDVAPTTDKNVDGKIDVLDLEESDVNNPATYSLPTPIDYQATFKPGDGSTIKYIDDNNVEQTATDGVTVLSRTEYERLLNERYYYAPISVKQTVIGGDGDDQDNPYPYYVVNKTMVLGDTPYAAGQVVDKATFDGLNDSEKANITTLFFTTQGTYYYCREGYKIDSTEGYNVSSATGVDGDVDGSYTQGQDVPAGVVIDASTYENLKNKQKNFMIHGLSPTETSTLYVIRNSDIKDLSTEKIITVVYQYDYVETDQNGLNITPVSERHVLNIHINFKSGIPIVDDIQAPKIVLPGTSISINQPYVQEGAYVVTGGGWELFDDDDDADSHTNGIEYTPNEHPLYLYQDKYLLAYYAKTYLGKTYSNAVPVSVANFHDLKKVMGDTDHHYYIDHKDVIDKGVDPKIYINDYRKVDENGVETSESKNGLDLLKNLFDLSLVTSSSEGYTVDNKGKITAATANTALKDHYLLDKTRVGGCENLQFFLNTDIDHGQTTEANPNYDSEVEESTTNPKTVTVDHPWTPVGDAGHCFQGTLHGDGHTISSLDKSLFYNLCGNVYNLGVTGSFTGAGVVDTGSGYVENCWINTTGNPDGSVYAVFGNPTAAAGVKQVVNSYYQAGKTYKSDPASDHGMAIAKPDKAFYNGEVAYDLNGFYLYKRYNDNANPGGSVTYQYWVPGNNQPQNGSYAENIALCSSGYNGDKYVENRFADGDFIYIGDGFGTIPTEEDIRHYTDDEGNSHYYPIWPDDYLFFGQRLNYGWEDGMTHQSTPSSIIRSDGRVVMDESGNRVYRAPAYYRNNTMNVAHFNPYAVFAPSKKNNDQVIAYKNMTAIDFTGGNGDVAGGYQLGLQGTKFYPPLLDDNGLTGFRNADLTKNLLVYTFAAGVNETAGEKTATVVSDYLLEPVYTESTDGYRTVIPQSVLNIKGHWVENGIAKRDHLLVDEEDFDAPIAYTFDKGRRMWYQREPAYDEFVDRTKGWQGISLPFTAELVTTNQKGEITHFYSGSEESKNNTKSKIGHEYWLRELNSDSKIEQLKENNQVVSGVLTAGFTYPTSQFSDDEKTVTNTFLWDYYYKGLNGGHNQKDHNKDTYQDYYSENRTYGNYPLLAGGTPYLLGLPGVTYYEFDLSGNFEPGTTTDTKPENLKKIVKQTITFASVPGTTIAVSEDQKTGVKKKVTIGNVDTYYYFKPNYLNEDFVAGSDVYTLVSQYDSTDDNVDNPDCSSFVKVPATGAVTQLKAFRPYFISSVSTPTRSIIFGSEEIDDQKGVVEHGDPKEEELNGGLTIWSKKDKIYVQSSLSFTEDLRVVTPAGITVATFTVKPGQTVEVQADFSGMYIVHTLDGKYTKKVSVKK